jgi:hypothetical protein
MYYERKIEYLNKHRIIYRRMPINDKPTKKYEWGYFFENGTHECYELFRSNAKINSFKSLKWHLLVLWYLNPKLNPDQFKNIMSFITNKKNGFTTFDIDKETFNNIFNFTYYNDLEKPPKNKPRKVIFKDFSMLTKEQKLSITGQLIGRGKIINENDVYEAMLVIHDNKEKITLPKLSGILGCSIRTIQRNFNDVLKNEKQSLNNEI